MGSKKKKKKKKRRRKEREGVREREIEGGGDQNTRIPGVPPIPSTQPPIQTGVGAPTAAGGDGLGSLCGPLLIYNPV